MVSNRVTPAIADSEPAGGDEEEEEIPDMEEFDEGDNLEDEDPVRWFVTFAHEGAWGANDDAATTHTVGTGEGARGF